MVKNLKYLVLLTVLALGMSAQAEESVVQTTVQHTAEQGDAKAQAKLGAMYLLGNGVGSVDVSKIDFQKQLLKNIKENRNPLIQ